MIRSSTDNIIQAMRILADEIQSNDGIANGAIAEAADRLEELRDALHDLYDFGQPTNRYNDNRDEALEAFKRAAELLKN